MCCSSTPVYAVSLAPSLGQFGVSANMQAPTSKELVGEERIKACRLVTDPVNHSILKPSAYFPAPDEDCLSEPRHAAALR